MISITKSFLTKCNIVLMFLFLGKTCNEGNLSMLLTLFSALKKSIDLLAQTGKPICAVHDDLFGMDHV